MDFLFEFLTEFLFESALEISSSKSINKKIRYPIIALIAVAVFAVIALLGVFGVILIASSKPHTTLGGVVIIIFDAFFATFVAMMCVKRLKNAG